MCADRTQYRQGSLNTPDATRCGASVQDAQDAQDSAFESGRNTTVSDADHLLADDPSTSDNVPSCWFVDNFKGVILL